ncbi:MAG TPA: 3-hydroxyisobutyrate dehydrogenase [Stellaceae bacterium]|nr:3-hydroxyisobutyrate dehydrogenase [Stellaceae bacterium]
MSKIGFIGLGNMGGPMAANLVKAGHHVAGFDLAAPAMEGFKKAGGSLAKSAAAAVAEAEVVVTMLPAGPQVRQAYTAEGGILASAHKSALLIDSSTIDVDTARAVTKAAAEHGFEMLDAPVSGGVGGAAAGTLTFMCGGTDRAFERAKPVLEKMGKTIVHAGAAGNGQAAKICNNMMMAVAMVGVCEGFQLAEKLGLDLQKLFDISSKSSGQSWAVTNYCPAPGPVPTAPSNRDYQAGFTADMMLKDLKLAQQAAQSVSAVTPMGAEAAALFQFLVGSGFGPKDFSVMYRFLKSTR